MYAVIFFVLFSLLTIACIVVKMVYYVVRLLLLPCRSIIVVFHADCYVFVIQLSPLLLFLSK